MIKRVAELGQDLTIPAKLMHVRQHGSASTPRIHLSISTTTVHPDGLAQATLQGLRNIQNDLPKNTDIKQTYLMLQAGGFQMLQID